MKYESQRWIWTIIAGALLLGVRDCSALGADHPNDRPVTGSTNWPAGLKKLVNTTNRVHGFFVNAEDVFFFTGTASEFTTFLQAYSQLEDVEPRRLILHDGRGEAKSPWEKSGRPCDWKLNVCPKGWRNVGTLSKQGTNSVAMLQQAAREPGYIVEIHFWTGGNIALEHVAIPKNVEVKKE